jgi:hypothetical protein
MEMGISLHRGPTWEAGGEVRLTGTSTDSKRGLWKQHLSLSLCEGNVEGGLHYWELCKLGLVSIPRQAQTDFRS